jgi:hypothetical protein|eukprot:COSAG06_NODE_1042_length_10980_cov_31.644150_6_plen_60_part_00
MGRVPVVNDIVSHSFSFQSTYMGTIPHTPPVNQHETVRKRNMSVSTCVYVSVSTCVYGT